MKTAPSAPAVSALVDAARAVVAEADTPPPVTLGDENPWNHVRYGERRPAPTYALALFPAAATVATRRVMVLEAWEGVAFACVEVDAYGIPEKRPTANHVLPEARIVLFREIGKKRVAPGAELAAKRAAYVEVLRLTLSPSGPSLNSDSTPSPAALAAPAQARGGAGILSAPEARAARKDACVDGQGRGPLSTR